MSIWIYKTFKMTAAVFLVSQININKNRPQLKNSFIQPVILTDDGIFQFLVHDWTPFHVSCFVDPHRSIILGSKAVVGHLQQLRLGQCSVNDIWWQYLPADLKFSIRIKGILENWALIQLFESSISLGDPWRKLSSVSHVILMWSSQIACETQSPCVCVPHVILFTCGVPHVWIFPFKFSHLKHIWHFCKVMTNIEFGVINSGDWIIKYWAKFLQLSIHLVDWWLVGFIEVAAEHSVLSFGAFPICHLR